MTANERDKGTKANSAKQVRIVLKRRFKDEDLSRSFLNPSACMSEDVRLDVLVDDLARVWVECEKEREQKWDGV